MASRSRPARGMMLIRYAMLCPELGKERPDGSPFSAACFIDPLANGFVYVGAGCDVEKALIGGRILDDGLSLAIHREYHGPLALFELTHKIPRAASKCRERLNVLGDIEHLASTHYLSTFIGADGKRRRRTAEKAG